MKLRWSFLSELGAGVLIMVGGIISSPDSVAQMEGSPGLSGDGLDFILYGEKAVTPLVEIQVKHLFVDYESRGFFRIGLLPVLVADDVRLRTLSPAGLTKALSAIQSWNLGANGARRLEMRNLEISNTETNAVHLHAALGRLAAEGVWELSEISVFDAHRQMLTLRAAALQITGPTAGMLNWSADGRPQQFSLFGNIQSPTNNPENKP